MTKSEYLNALAYELQRLNESDRMDALQYYEEYFDEAGPEREQEVIAELGHPKLLAHQIRAEIAYRVAAENPKSTKKGIRAALIGIGAFFAIPVAIPLALALVILVLSLLIVLLALFVSGILVGVCSIVSLIMTFILLFVSPPTAVSMFGVTLLTTGLAGLIIIPTMMLSRTCFRGLASLLNRKLRKSKAQEMYQ